MIKIPAEIDFDEKSQLSSLVSSINFNSKANLSYYTSQDVFTLNSPVSGIISTSDNMSKQIKEAIINGRTSFIQRCDTIKQELNQLLSQLD
jgi:hypothetical protein